MGKSFVHLLQKIHLFFFFPKMVPANFNECESGSVLSWLSSCPERKLLSLSFGLTKFL